MAAGEPSKSGVQRFWARCSSTELSLVLFLLIAFLVVPGTIFERARIYGSPFFVLLIALFGAHLLICTIRRFKALPWPVLLLHGGVIVVLAGFVLRSQGYVATVNVYEGTGVDQVYRWDMDQDVSLDYRMVIKRIHREYYPVPVRVGVLLNGSKAGLHELKTGGWFETGGYRVKVDSLDVMTESLKLLVYRQNRLVGSCDTAGFRELPADFPMDFKLVAYQNPALKRQWVEIALMRDGRLLAEGTSEVNSPFKWNGIFYYNTQLDRDQGGMSFAGIQIVKDPGKPVVFTGLGIMAAGSLLLYGKRFFRKSAA